MTDHIKIAAISPRIQYLGNGAQKAFSYPFPIFKAADLEVYFGAALQATGYAVTGAGSDDGGTVTFTVAPANGVVVTLRRRLEIERITDFQATGIMPSDQVNSELDYQTAAIQQIADDAGRAVARSPFSTSTADLTLPEPAAGKALRWNDAGDGLVNTTIIIDTILPQAQAQADAAAASAAAASISQAAASAQASASAASRTAADTAAAATAADRTVVAADKAETHADKLAADASAAAASTSAAAAAAAKTGCDTAAAATAADRTAVAADKAETHADKLAADASAAGAATSQAAAAGSASASAASASAAHDSEVAAAASAAAASAAASGGAVKVSSTDTTSDYLTNTLVAGSNIGLTVINPSGNETLRISVTGLAAVATSGAYGDLSGKPTLGSAASLNAGAGAANLPTVAAMHAMVCALSQ